MGLLAQLFRHKNSAPLENATVPEPDGKPAGDETRGVGAVAVAAGVQAAHGMPEEFALALGEVLPHVPEPFVRPGNHDTTRTLRIPSADIAPGFARGRAQIALARLAALAPDVFRDEVEPGESPEVRLPLQKLLQQIRTTDVATASKPEPESAAATDASGATDPQAHEIAPDHTRAASIHGIPEPAAQIPDQSPLNEPAPAALPSPLPEPPADAPGHPVTLARPTPPEMPPPVAVAAAAQPEDRRELRPEKNPGTSTTLRAVVLGGVSTSDPSRPQAQAAHVLAPRVTVTATATAAPVILGPSVVPSANDGSFLLAPRTTPDFAGLQNLFMTQDALDLTGVAKLATALPGVTACVISGAAGGATAGDFTHGVTAEEVRAASANLLRRAGGSMETVNRGESDIAIFLHGDTCVAVIVKAGGFVPGVRERLARVAELLAGSLPVK